MPPPVNKCDRALFSASTTVQIGDGRKVKFWHDSWLDGLAPNVIAPTIFAITTRKNRSVHDDITEGAWVCALRGKISNAVQLDEFVSLWLRLQARRIRLNSSAPSMPNTQTLSGKPRPKTSANSSPGFLCRTRSSPSTISPSGAGRTLLDVPFALILMRPGHTFSFDAPLPGVG
ncbi:hypothetical protein BRADI_4g37815v3 [Brachypodium distachyon]|uniref:Uncharacterized protein n=1 Tax=Brachypodium distachyon TaxID=15368 RepID=A0A2K2CSX6_BRADI|nr:hypothetical protein BRADI_4g37815v3 [Brachypodium distachyon]